MLMSLDNDILISQQILLIWMRSFINANDWFGTSMILWICLSFDLGSFVIMDLRGGDCLRWLRFLLSSLGFISNWFSFLYCLSFVYNWLSFLDGLSLICNNWLCFLLHSLCLILSCWLSLFLQNTSSLILDLLRSQCDIFSWLNLLS